MSPTIHVLSVGTEEPIQQAYMVFLERHGCVVETTKCCRSLSQSCHEQECDVALLQVTLTPRELEEVARLIRQRWPKAQILIIRREAWCIEDALYDDRVEPGINPERLLSTIRRVLSSREMRLPLSLESR
jgi:DNA-binding NtrC family response regulator